MRKGQALVEVMIALSILVVGFFGILSLLTQSLHINKNITTDTTATYLASEGIELAKNLIDHDVYQHLDPFVAGPGWGATFGAGGDYELDYTTCNNLANPSAACVPPKYSSADFLNYDPVTHLYLYAFDDLGGPDVPTGFTRRIRVTPNGAIPEITIQSTVTWSVGLGGTQDIVLEDHFYNWHP